MTDHRPAPVVFLHVGEPKSGTTYLQDILWGNRSALAQQGVELPGASIWEQFRATQDLRQEPQSETDPAGSWTGEWDILAAEAVQANRMAIISHEMLVGASAEQAARAVRSLRPAEVHIVLTVRDISGLLPAEWQETIKHRNRVPWNQWLAAIIDSDVPLHRRRRWFWRAHDTEGILSRWAAEVPPERVHVITTPRRGSAPTLLWERFASVLGIDPGLVDTSTARPNASLGLPEVEFLRRLNERLPADLPEWFYSSQVKERLAHQVLADRPTAGRLAVPPDRQAWIEKRAEELIGALRSSGYHIVGDLDDLRPPAPSSGGVDPAQVTDGAVLDAALDAAAWLIRDEWQVAQAVGQLPQVAATPTKLLSTRLARTVRELSARYPAVARLRVVGWRVVQRLRARKPAA